ncbi:uncharacterized protein DUF4013 [Roseimicrobium gellanilyticum]|uniref:Uncharacterized protein DUF4013 n=1 Tax=Roseimicrobium gellanilyticum TaxID=748857 RepID=A0A366HE48_9BACT|nr:DUF4013 domain-containing protein [Roseimicrobium gellanilyticum]RBP39588.1 uncharacterized protein DUF4013 [Roseimicrobium gellanilyticum]
MNYIASITDFFKSPKWGMNLLLGIVAFIIPAVGPIVLAGWLITGLYGRKNDENPATFPDFDFQYFMKYLERGVWPFLVSLVSSFALIPVMMVVMFVPMLLIGAMGSNSSGDGASIIGLLMMVVMFGLYALAMAAFFFVTTPMIIRSTITQDFAKAFDFGFVKRFLILTKGELMMAALFMLGVGIVYMILGVITCYLGFLAGGPVMFYAWHHLQKQLYKTYLSRGGDPVPYSPKLTDDIATPPSLVK